MLRLKMRRKPSNQDSLLTEEQKALALQLSSPAAAAGEAGAADAPAAAAATGALGCGGAQHGGGT